MVTITSFDRFNTRNRYKSVLRSDLSPLLGTHMSISYVISCMICLNIIKISIFLHNKFLMNKLCRIKLFCVELGPEVYFS